MGGGTRSSDSIHVIDGISLIVAGKTQLHRETEFMEQEEVAMTRVTMPENHVSVMNEHSFTHAGEII